jgi:DNA-binding transcriptional ArsR family regulator
LLIRSLDRRFGGLKPFVPVLEECGYLEVWHSNIVGAIPLRARLNYDHLKCAENANYEYLGWCCRNLLELLIWALYVTTSKENARRLFEDYIIDAEHLVTHLRELLQIFAVEPHPEVERHLKTLSEQESVLRQERDRSRLRENSRYLDVGKIAKEVGMARTFASLNRILSKLAHPTSLSILLALPHEPDAGLRRFMFRIGLISAKDCLDVMCEYLKRLNVETALIEDATFVYPPTLRP